MAKSFYIEEDECIGCEACVEICPDAFAFNETSGKASVKNTEGCEEDVIEEAMETCPAHCIYWEE